MADASANVVVSLVTVQAVAVYLLQKAKAATWIPFMQKNSVTLNRLTAIIAAGIGAAGVHAAWNGVQHTLTITGLDPAGVATALWHWLSNFAFQQLVYHGVVKNGNGAVMGMLNPGKPLPGPTVKP